MEERLSWPYMIIKTVCKISLEKALTNYNPQQAATTNPKNEAASDFHISTL